MNNELVLKHAGKVTRCGPFRMTATGLEVDGNPSFEEWERCGAFLHRAAGAVQWWIGDWMLYGDRSFGEMAAQAYDAVAMNLPMLKQCQSVASRFDKSRRLDLSFSHHAEVAYLPADQADSILRRALSDDLSTREVRTLVRQAKAAAALDAPPSDECCTTADLWTLVRKGMKFGTVYADPPWSYDNQGTRASTDNHYSTMAVEDIAALPVGKLAADKAHLWLWTTNAFLFECPRIFDAWGFEFKSSYVWVKPQMGIGNYLRNSHEFLLLAVRGGLTGAARDVMSWGQFDRTEHSAKPDPIRHKVIESLSPGPRLELFGRNVVSGWVVWGNQVRRQQSFMDGPIVEITEDS